MYGKYEEPGMQEEVVRSVTEKDIANLRFFIADGADPDMRDARGIALLHHAAMARDCAAAALLIATGADPDSRCGDLGYTAMQYAANRGDTAMIELLLKAGADPKLADRDGDTPLHAAVRAGALEAVKTLVAGGAPLEARNTLGLTPLQVARGRFDKLDREGLDGAACFRDIGIFLHTAAHTPDREAQIREKVARDLATLRGYNPKRLKLRF